MQAYHDASTDEDRKASARSKEAKKPHGRKDKEGWKEKKRKRSKDAKGGKEKSGKRRKSVGAPPIALTSPRNGLLKHQMCMHNR